MWPQIPFCTSNRVRNLFSLIQRGDRRICSWRGRLHSSVGMWGSKRQSDGTVDHDQRVQDRVGRARHRCHSMFSIRKAGQERQGIFIKITDQK